MSICPLALILLTVKSPLALISPEAVTLPAEFIANTGETVEVPGLIAKVSVVLSNPIVYPISSPLAENYIATCRLPVL